MNARPIIVEFTQFRRYNLRLQGEIIALEAMKRHILTRLDYWKSVAT